MTYEQMVRAFHERMGQALDQPPNLDLLDLRADLILEEAHEVIQATNRLADILYRDGETDLTLPKGQAALLKELVDLQYVLSGFVVSLGWDQQFTEAFKRVHASNMSKLGPDGRPLYRQDGKVLKGPNYQAADIEGLFA